MNCEEFRLQLCQPAMDTESAAHLECCASCRNLAYTQQAVNACLKMARAEALEPPPSLDEAVMQAFRRRTSASAHRWRIPMRVLWPAVAALLMVSLVVALKRGKSESIHAGRAVQADRTVVTANQAVDAGPMNPGRAVAAGTVIEKGKPAAPRKLQRSVRQERIKQKPVHVLVEADGANNDFQNLMYCDALSCTGDLQMIRIQLPASAITRVPSLRQANGLMQADVVVGSDGIARAIRIVK